MAVDVWTEDPSPRGRAQGRRRASGRPRGLPGEHLTAEVLERIEQRVLWLAMSIVHHANRVRPNTSGIKVGGHQASSASMVSMMTAMWFAWLRAEDQVSVKPHASPVLHAINYLLGHLDREHLTSLREFHGLQSYPSRTKDPDPVDFSTGSVGLGAAAPVWAAIARRYAADHFEMPPRGRQVALIGDAELDEGACWEAIVDPMVARLGEVLWVVDLNRQSLDRVVPDIAVPRMVGMFAAAGWNTVTVKYGHLLQDLFGRPGGEDLRRRIDQMSNEEYQRLLRSSPADLRDRLAGGGKLAAGIRKVSADLDDTTLRQAVRNLGGHDLHALLDAFVEVATVTDRPSVMFAYTIKGWSLPSEGHPANHSSLMTQAEWEGLAPRLGADAADPWAAFPHDSAEARACAEVAARLTREPVALSPAGDLPVEIGRGFQATASTQQALGSLLLDIRREAPEAARRMVTVSPDVASSTNLGGWINKAGIWSVGDRPDWFQDDPETLVHWKETTAGQHIPLGIAETNLVELLGELGATWSRYGQPLLPIGTLYDPFVGRALEPWSFGIYSGGQSILVGTPSGVTLAPEGGAHQSIITPSIGIEQPGCTAWEPAFCQDLEWTLLHALAALGRPDGTSAYFRLSTRPIPQALAGVPAPGPERVARHRQVLAGGYRLLDLAPAGAAAAVTIAAVGAVVPEAEAAARLLAADGVAVDLLVLTSPDLVFRAHRANLGLAGGESWILDHLLPAGRPRPIVTVLDGHPHTLAFMGSVRGVRTTNLGVTEFGQSSSLEDAYLLHGLDAENIAGAALDLID